MGCLGLNEPPSRWLLRAQLLRVGAGVRMGETCSGSSFGLPLCSLRLIRVNSAYWLGL